MWVDNMFYVMYLKNLGLPGFGHRAIWNPLFGGTTFSYLCFFGNLEIGCAMIDCHAQLRITLHLFHALRVNGIIHEGQIPLLDMLHNCFKSSKGIWEGELPKKGEFVKRFWICFGMNIATAKIMAERAKLIAQAHCLVPAEEESWKQRKMSPLEPSKISKCYRRICNRDFHDVKDKYHTPDQRRRMGGSDQYILAVRKNDTLDALQDEQVLLSFNLPTCGALLEQFICSLGRVLQWEPLLAGGVDDSILGEDKRQGFAVLFAQHLLGALDFSQDPLSFEFLDIPLGEASSSFMTQFFSQFIDPSKVLWFQATQEEI